MSIPHGATSTDRPPARIFDFLLGNEGDFAREGFAQEDVSTASDRYCYLRPTSKHIQFGVLTPQEMWELAEIEVFSNELYQVPDKSKGQNRTVQAPFGSLDKRLVRDLSTSSIDLHLFDI